MIARRRPRHYCLHGKFIFAKVLYEVLLANLRLLVLSQRSSESELAIVTLAALVLPRHVPFARLRVTCLVRPRALHGGCGLKFSKQSHVCILAKP